MIPSFKFFFNNLRFDFIIEINCLFQGNMYEAVESFHKALGIRRDDTFSTTMLNNVIEQLMVEEPPFQGLNRIQLLYFVQVLCPSSCTIP